jgi:hypothetical protein
MKKMSTAKKTTIELQSVTLGFKDLVKHILYNLKQNVPMYIKGYSGFGKTAAVQIAASQYAKESDKPVVYCAFYGSANEGSDFNGLQWIVDGELKSFRPEKFNLKKGTTYVFFFDELNRCRKDVRNALLPLFARPEHRRIGEHDLSAYDIRLMSAGNAGHDDFQVDELDPAFNERVRHATLQAHIKEVCEHFEQKYPQNLFNLFLQGEHRQSCFAADFSDVISMTHAEKPVPRMLEYAVQACDKLKADQIDSFVLTAMQMTVGMLVVSAFRDFLDKLKRLDANEIFKEESKELDSILSSDVNATNAEMLLTALKQACELVKTDYAGDEKKIRTLLSNMLDKISVKYAEVIAATIKLFTETEAMNNAIVQKIILQDRTVFDKLMSFSAMSVDKVEGEKPETKKTAKKK